LLTDTIELLEWDPTNPRLMRLGTGGRVADLAVRWLDEVHASESGNAVLDALRSGEMVTLTLCRIND
jgi:hypothetical protein